MSTPSLGSQTSKPLNDFLSSINSEKLCTPASKLRSDIACKLGAKIVGGYNVLFEIVFDDGVTWLARCPFPYNSSSQDAADKLLQSYAAALKYIKLNTTIPVPEVFACCSKSDEGNEVGSSYMLMERLPGRTIDMPDIDEDEDGYESVRESAKKIFKQLSNFIMQLASLQFEQIGSLQERPGSASHFAVEEYFDAGIVYPVERGQIYEASTWQGPFKAVSEFRSAILALNQEYAKILAIEDYALGVKHCSLLRSILDLPEYENGPFVLNHDDLSSSNILIDDDFNITGIIDFPGTVVPLASLCTYPMIVRENCVSPYTDKELWLECFLEAQPYPGSALNDVQIRKTLMKDARARSLLDTALSHEYAYGVLEGLVEKFGIEVCRDEPHQADGLRNDDKDDHTALCAS